MTLYKKRLKFSYDFFEFPKYGLCYTIRRGVSQDFKKGQEIKLWTPLTPELAARIHMVQHIRFRDIPDGTRWHAYQRVKADDSHYITPYLAMTEIYEDFCMDEIVTLIWFTLEGER